MMTNEELFEEWWSGKSDDYQRMTAPIDIWLAACRISKEDMRKKPDPEDFIGACDPSLLSDSEAVRGMFRELAAKPESGWTYQISLALDDGFRFYDMVVADVGHSDKGYVFQCDDLEALVKHKDARIAELEAAQPPDGHPSWEDWLWSEHGITIEPTEYGDWKLVDNKVGRDMLEVSRFSDHTTALAAAMKEAGR